MWGDPEKATSLNGNDRLASVLYQICSPAHIPWGDQRWQELLHGYDVWVHMDDSHELIQQYSPSMVKHAEISSNLAALSLHVTRMLRELAGDIRVTTTSDSFPIRVSTNGRTVESTKENNTNYPESENQQLLAVDNFTKQISRVAKARATAGALQLFKLLCHPVVVESSSKSTPEANRLAETLTYQTRGDLPTNVQADIPLMHSILDLIAAVGNHQTVLKTAEMYDAVVFSFHVLFVLCGTQLYRPFQSSFHCSPSFHYILDELFLYSDDGRDMTIEDHYDIQASWTSSHSSSSVQWKSKAQKIQSHPNKRVMWTPKSIVKTFLEWQLRRPEAPKGSLAEYNSVLAQAVAANGGEKPDQDGMYESFMVVQATAPLCDLKGDREDAFSDLATSIHAGFDNRVAIRRPSTSHGIILDATRGVLNLSGKIILLPFRLVSLMLGIFAANKRMTYRLRQDEMMKRFASTCPSRTRDILWLSTAPIADLGLSLLLLLINNKRNEKHNNPFRAQLNALADNRWDEHDEGMALPDLPHLGATQNGIFLSNGDSIRVEDLGNSEHSLGRKGSVLSPSLGNQPITLNFELLFHSLGRTVHTEIGALLLYTLLQSSPSFAESLAARSDLDTLVMPLLRNMYLASSSHTYVAKDYASSRSISAKPGLTPFDIRSFPFRSLSHLYVIIILLLLFSQDSSFGRDAFKRISVTNVVWYKERHLKNINLGSILVLTLLRSLLFNLNRLHDVFLLSNCCAVIMNLSTSPVGLHEYASMRLASVAVTVMKKYAKLAALSPEMNSHEMSLDEELGTPLGMHAEVAHTLLAMIKRSLAPDSIKENLHLIYALVYHQMNLIKLCMDKNIYHSKETERIQNVILKASSLIEAEGTRTASKAMLVLELRVDQLVAAAIAADAKLSPKPRKKARQASDDFTYTYEEDTDPEIFFVPYVWEVLVCCTTSNSISWNKDEIRAFALLEVVDASNNVDESEPSSLDSPAEYTTDREDQV